MSVLLAALVFAAAPHLEAPELEALRIDRAVLRRLLELELAGAELSRIEVRADSTVTLTWRDGVELTRPFELPPQGAPAARARALALLIGELSQAKPPAALAVPAAPRPVPAPAAVEPAKAPLPAPLAPPAARPNAFFVSAGVRAYPSFDTLLFRVNGGALLPLRAVSIRVEPAVAFGRAEDELGEIWLTQATLGAGVELEGGGPSVSFAIGPRVELGWAFANGVARAPGAVAAAQNTLMASAGVGGAFRVAAPAGVRLQLEVELGWGLRGLVARVDAARVAGMAGPLAGLSLGIVVP